MTKGEDQVEDIEKVIDKVTRSDIRPLQKPHRPYKTPQGSVSWCPRILSLSHSIVVTGTVILYAPHQPRTPVHVTAKTVRDSTVTYDHVTSMRS